MLVCPKTRRGNERNLRFEKKGKIKKTTKTANSGERMNSNVKRDRDEKKRKGEIWICKIDKVKFRKI